MENCQTQTHYRKRCHGIDRSADLDFFLIMGNNATVSDG